MSAAEIVDRPSRGARALRRLRRWARRLAIALGCRLGLLPRRADRGYVICATPRSGSNYLCQLLASTGQLGRPLEYFNTQARQRHTDPAYPRDRDLQIDMVRTMGATPNGIYAAKILPLQYLRVTRKVDLFHALPNLKFVRLHRRDLLGQALSLSRVRQTGQIMAAKQANAAPVYNAADIRTCIRDVQAREAIWDQVMRAFGMRPLLLAYEDVMRDPQAAIDQVAALMGLAPMPVNPDLVRVTVQRDRDTEAWRQRFLAETGDEFRHLEN